MSEKFYDDLIRRLRGYADSDRNYSTSEAAEMCEAALVIETLRDRYAKDVAHWVARDVANVGRIHDLLAAAEGALATLRHTSDRLRQYDHEMETLVITLDTTARKLAVAIRAAKAEAGAVDEGRPVPHHGSGP